MAGVFTPHFKIGPHQLMAWVRQQLHSVQELFSEVALISPNHLEISQIGFHHLQNFGALKIFRGVFFILLPPSLPSRPIAF